MSVKAQNWFSSNSGDAAMMYMVMIAGMNFVVLRDGVSDFSPLAFNALRFALASLVVMLPLLISRVRHMDIPRADLIRFVLMTGVGLTFVQIMLVTSVKLTTAANASLMMATGPAWTVMLLVLIGQQRLNRYLVIGLLVMLAGTSVIVLAGGDGIALSSSDLLGCIAMLMGTIAAAAHVVMTQPVVERNRSFDLGLIKHTTVSASVLLIALPELWHIQPSQVVSPDILPNIIFAGIIASVSGTFTTTFAQRKIGATRMKAYDNVRPLSAALFAFFLLGEPLTWLQLIGGILTIGGVIVIRRYSSRVMVGHREAPAELVPARQS